MLLEICVDTVAGLEAALAGGADRIELCSALALGGLTPGPGLMAEAAGCGVPVMAMVRHRAGDFVLSAADLEIAHDDIAAARRAGLDGVVIGASLADGRLDAPALHELALEARGMDITLHRCFDLVPDVAEALDVMRSAGIGRVLTSGGALTVADGMARLAETYALAGDDIVVMPGSGVTVETVPALVGLGAREVHASASVAVAPAGPAARLGFASATDRQTDAEQVAALKAALG